MVSVIRTSRTFRSSAVRAFAALVLSVGASSAASVQANAASTKKVKCDASSGWSALAGRAPTFVAGGPTGLYLWQERGTWRVGATNDRGTQTTFTATVTFDASISGKPVGTEGKSDIVEVRAQSVRLRFSNFGGLDGVAIEAPCASTIGIQGSIDGQPLTSQQVFLGSSAANPASIPASVTRSIAPVVAATSTVVGVPVSTSAVTTLGVQATPAVVVACSATAWPAALTGRPAFRRGPAGIYVWLEKGILRLAFEADPGSPRLIEGRVVANGPVTVRSLANERKDQVKVSGQQVTFSLRVGGGGDAFDVVAPCATSFSIDATIDGVAVASNQVFVGPNAAPPAALPLVLSRS